MQQADIPTKVDIVWAQDAGPDYVREVPDTVQQPTLPYAASYPVGFPPDTFLPLAAGGSGPDGRDMNGVLQQLSAWAQWQAAGGPIIYDSTFQTGVGGYPKGALIASAVTTGVYWVSTADNNLTNPDTGGAGWSALLPVVRRRLAADTTFYVSPTGNDANSGLSSGAAWATLQGAWDNLQFGYELNGFKVTVQLAAGTYAGLTALGALLGQNGGFGGVPTSLGPGPLLFLGDNTTPANVIIGTASGDLITAASGAYPCFSGVTFRNTDANKAILAAFNGGVIGYKTCNFATNNGGNHINLGQGGFAYAFGNYTISAGGFAHWSAGKHSGIIVLPGTTITTAGTPTFTEFAAAPGGSIQVVASNFAGSGATGSLYNISINGVIDTGGAGTGFFPGNAAGTITTGGQYI